MGCSLQQLLLYHVHGKDCDDVHGGIHGDEDHDDVHGDEDHDDNHDHDDSNYVLPEHDVKHHELVDVSVQLYAIDWN